MLRNVRQDVRECSFQVIFLKDDKYQSVEVQELRDIDFLVMQQRLLMGESIFITRKRPPLLQLRPGRKRVKTKKA